MNQSQPIKPDVSARYLTISPMALLPFATVVSLLFSGYVPKFNNNIYHLHILMQDYDLPQFQDDAFVQSLRHFSSGFWMVFAGAGKYVNPALFLSIWLFITHLAFLASCLHLAASLGYRENRQRNIFLLLASCSSLCLGEAVGGGGLMINYFTHSELANASLVFGLSFAIRGRYWPAALLVCVTFFLNAFMAVWMLPSLVLLALYQMSTGKLPLKRFVLEGTAGSLLGVVFLLPPLVNIVANPEVSGASDFSYPAFLWDFYPYHFFLSALSSASGIKLLTLVLALLLTCGGHPGRTREFSAVAIGALVLMGAAAVVPMVTDSRLILNLHLVRGAVLVSILAFVSVAAIASQWLTHPVKPLHYRLGLAMCGILVLPIQFSPILVLLLLFERATRSGFIPEKYSLHGAVKLVTAGIFLVCLGALPLRAYSAVRQSVETIRLNDQWARIGAWARLATPASTVFQVPHNGAVSFGHTSQRKIWSVDKYGAAVMWSPSYYRIWEERKFAATATSPAAVVDRLQGKVDYLGDTCTSLPPGQVVFRDGDTCVYELNPSLLDAAINPGIK